MYRMENFKAHRLRFVTEVQNTIELNEHQGSAIRGALFHAMRDRFCSLSRGGRRNRHLKCNACPLVATCPVAELLSTLKPGAPGGRDVPRPYTIQPPLPGRGGHLVENDQGRLFFHYQPGERFSFGLTLYAQALQLFPYLILTIKTFEDQGIGRRMARDNGRWLRGTLAIQEIWAENPLTGDQQAVKAEDDDMVYVPDIPITASQIDRLPTPAPNTPITLQFLTPTRLVQNSQLVKPHVFRFKPLLQRLLDRLESLSRDFSDTKLAIDFSSLVAASEKVRVVENQLRWEELHSYSTRRRRDTPTSGLLGSVTVSADDWRPFWHLLAWGAFTHVGKDATKGNGWYKLAERKNQGAKSC
ncbi:CRISPR system precrRNA processing endoribonuclease RAMP protein Cas6 [candidate division KSB3 bacterium]|nr:CRISPR system precrRNA processing endoribonuclease RAMP protein Cas6 [candidate division KSB3 bacterium]